MAFNTQFGTGMFGWNQSFGGTGSAASVKTQDNDTYNPRYPGFNKENYEKLEKKVSELGLTGSKKQEVMDQFYRQILPQVEQEKKKSQREAVLNQKKFEISQIKDDVQRKVANHTYTVEELAQKVKEKENLREDAPDAEVFNTWISTIPNGEELLGNYMNKGDKELLYAGGLEARPQKSFGDKAEEFAVGVAQSPGKWGYNLVGQLADRIGKRAGEGLANLMSDEQKQGFIDFLDKNNLISRKEIENYGAELQRQKEEGTTFNGREQTDIRTPILGEERANSKNVKAGEIVGDIGTAIALTSPAGAYLAPIIADSSAVGATLLGAGEGILDTALTHVGSQGDFNIKPSEVIMGGITGGLGGLFTRYLANLPKNQADNIRKEASGYIERSIKPTVKGKQNQTAYNKFIDDTLDVAHAMSKNKDILQYSDDAGEIVTGKLPTNLRETSETLGNMKKVIYDQYNEIAKQAGDAGARVNMNKAFDQLDDLTRDISQNISNPGTKGIVDNFKNTLLEYTDDAGTISIDDAQKITQDFNQQLTAFFKNQNLNDVSKSSIIAKLNKWTKEAIDESMDDAFNNSISNGSSMSTQYNQLKTLYSKIKTIEDEIAKRALVDARKNTKGMSTTILDALAGGEFTDALLTADPVKASKAGVMKAISKYYNYLNNPNTQINNLFKLVDRTYNPSKLSSTMQGVKEGIRSAAQSATPVVVPGTVAIEETLTSD